MSMFTQTGKVVGWEQVGVKDMLSDSIVVNVTLRKENGDEIVVRVRPDWGVAINSSVLRQMDKTNKAILKIDADARVSDNQFVPPHTNVQENGVFAGYDARIRVGIGDVVQVGWDYHRYEAYVLKIGERKKLMPWEFEYTETQVGNFMDILNSLYPRGLGGGDND